VQAAFELVLDDRECMLEELRIYDPELTKLSLAGGAPHLRSLELSNCGQLLSVHVADASRLRRLSILRPHQSTRLAVPKLAIEKASALVHLGLFNMEHRGLHLLEPVPETLACLDIRYSEVFTSRLS
jgi:hypothetical protein